jgi:hypothetical protein
LQDARDVERRLLGDVKGADFPVAASVRTTVTIPSGILEDGHVRLSLSRSDNLSVNTHQDRLFSRENLKDLKDLTKRT